MSATVDSAPMQESPYRTSVGVVPLWIVLGGIVLSVVMSLATVYRTRMYGARAIVAGIDQQTPLERFEPSADYAMALAKRFTMEMHNYTYHNYLRVINRAAHLCDQETGLWLYRLAQTGAIAKERLLGSMQAEVHNTKIEWADEAAGDYMVKVLVVCKQVHGPIASEHIVIGTINVMAVDENSDEQYRMKVVSFNYQRYEPKPTEDDSDGASQEEST